MAGHKGTPQLQYNSPSTWAELEKQSSRKSHDKQKHRWEELKEPLIKKLRAEIDFGISNMVVT